MHLTSIGPVEGGPNALLAKVREALTTLEGSERQEVRLAILYLPFAADHNAYLRGLRMLLTCPIMGATTGGAAFTERGVSSKGAVLGLITGAVEITCTVARDISPDDMQPLEAALQSLPRHLGKHQTVLTLADPFAVDGEVLARTLRRSTQSSCQHLGGTAGDNWSFVQPLVFFNTEVLSRAAVVASFGTDAPMVGGFRHGWCPALDHANTVTKASGSTLFELDHRPALAVYIEALQKAGIVNDQSPYEHIVHTTNIEEIIGKLAIHSLGMRSIFSDEMRVRTPMSIDITSGSIQLAGAIPEGATVTVLTAEPDTLIAAATEVAQSVYGALQRENRQPKGALVVNCAGRNGLLKERFVEEVFALDNGTQVPMIGFTSYGEVARLQGKIEGFHNTTVVLAAW